MKRLSLFCLLIIPCLMIKAQMLQIAEGPVFPNPIPGVSRIMQMKNGSTMFLHIAPDTSWNIHVYEPKYKAKTETYIQPSSGKLLAGHVEGIFEINGDAVLMISYIADNTTMLYRIIIDGTSGKLKDEQQIAMAITNPVKKGDTKTAVLLQPRINVCKDPDSENYAIAITNSFVSDTSKRIEIILFGTDNKQLNRAYYSSSVEKYKYITYVDMAVIGSDLVAAVLYCYNLKDNDEKEGELIFAGLDKGAKKVVFKEMDFSNDLIIERGITRYDKQAKRLLMLSTAKVKSEWEKLSTYLAYIDPFTRTVLTNTKVPGEKLMKRYSETFGKGNDYEAVPQNLFINNDFTFTILFEEMEILKEKNSMSQSIRNIAVANYDNEVDLKSCYFIPVDHFIPDNPLQSFYQSEREFAGQQFIKDNQYKSWLYISDGHNNFVLLNDTELNNQPVKNKITRLTDITDADAYYYPLTGTEAVPKRKYVFEKPVNKDFRKTAVFTVNDYDKANNILVILKTEKEEIHPGVKLVWLQP